MKLEDIRMTQVHHNGTFTFHLEFRFNKMSFMVIEVEEKEEKEEKRGKLIEKEFKPSEFDDECLVKILRVPVE